MRVVMTRVLPVPAPASTSTGPPRWSTAARCSGLSSATRRSTSSARDVTAGCIADADREGEASKSARGARLRRRLVAGGAGVGLAAIEVEELRALQGIAAVLLADAVERLVEAVGAALEAAVEELAGGRRAELVCAEADEPDGSRGRVQVEELHHGAMERASIGGRGDGALARHEREVLELVLERHAGRDEAAAAQARRDPLGLLEE